MSDYPAGVYSPRTKENAPSIVYDADQTTRLYAEDVVKLDDEVVAIETELGTDPKGHYSDVTARLDATDSAFRDMVETVENAIGELEDLTERVVKTADETVNNSIVYQADDELKLWVPANKFISFDVTMIVDIKAASDFKYGFLLPAGYSWGWYQPNYKGMTVTPKDIALGTTVSHSANGRIFGSCSVIFQNGATGGYITLAWGQLTAVAEDTVMKAGSCITNIVRL